MPDIRLWPSGKLTVALVPAVATVRFQSALICEDGSTVKGAGACEDHAKLAWLRGCAVVPRENGACWFCYPLSEMAEARSSMHAPYSGIRVPLTFEALDRFIDEVEAAHAQSRARA